VVEKTAQSLARRSGRERDPRTLGGLLGILKPSDTRIAACLVAFFISEVAISPWFGHPYDMEVWFRTGQWMLEGRNIYKTTVHISYTPLWAYWTAVAYLVYELSGSIPVWRVAVKLPLIVGHVLIAYVAWKWIRRMDASGAKRALVMILASIFIYIAPVWGQLETLVSLSLLLSALRTVSKQPLHSGLFAGVAVALKQYALLPAIALGLLEFKSYRSMRALVKYVGSLAAVPVAATIGTVWAFGWEPETIYFLSVTTSLSIVSGPPQGIWVFGGLSPWSLLHMLGINIQGISILAFAWVPAELGVLAYIFARLNNATDEAARAIILSISALLVSWPWPNEEMFSSTIPFAVVLAVILRNRRLQIATMTSQLLVLLFDVFDDGLLILLPGLRLISHEVSAAIENLYAGQFAVVFWTRGLLAFGAWITFLSLLSLAATIRKLPDQALRRTAAAAPEKVRCSGANSC